MFCKFIKLFKSKQSNNHKSLRRGFPSHICSATFNSKWLIVYLLVLMSARPRKLIIIYFLEDAPYDIAGNYWIPRWWIGIWSIRRCHFSLEGRYAPTWGVSGQVSAIFKSGSAGSTLYHLEASSRGGTA